MKYRRKPVSRDVVDAIFNSTEAEYIVERGGMVERISKSEFEAQYEPVKRERVAKPKRARKEKVAA